MDTWIKTHAAGDDCIAAVCKFWLVDQSNYIQDPGLARYDPLVSILNLTNLFKTTEDHIKRFVEWLREHRHEELYYDYHPSGSFMDACRSSGLQPLRKLKNATQITDDNRVMLYGPRRTSRQIWPLLPSPSSSSVIPE